MISQPAAIYLVGHGAPTDPRPIELQHLRIIRAIKLIKKELEVNFHFPQQPYIDLNFPRSSFSLDKISLALVPEVVSRDFPSLLRLAEDVERGDFSLVLMDLAVGLHGNSYYMGFVHNLLDHRGARIVNCYHQTPGFINEEERRTVPAWELGINTEPDYRDFIAFFPRLVGNVAMELMGYENEILRRRERPHLQSEEPVPYGMSLQGFKEVLRRMTTRYGDYSDDPPRLPKIFRDIQELARKAKDAGAEQQASSLPTEASLDDQVVE